MPGQRVALVELHRPVQLDDDVLLGAEWKQVDPDQVGADQLRPQRPRVSGPRVMV